jgi:hypothetical protein
LFPERDHVLSLLLSALLLGPPAFVDTFGAPRGFGAPAARRRRSSSTDFVGSGWPSLFRYDFAGAAPGRAMPPVRAVRSRATFASLLPEASFTCFDVIGISCPPGRLQGASAMTLPISV